MSTNGELMQPIFTSQLGGAFGIVPRPGAGGVRRNICGCEPLNEGYVLRYTIYVVLGTTFFGCGPAFSIPGIVRKLNGTNVDVISLTNYFLSVHGMLKP